MGSVVLCSTLFSMLLLSLDFHLFTVIKSFVCSIASRNSYSLKLNHFTKRNKNGKIRMRERERKSCSKVEVALKPHYISNEDFSFLFLLVTFHSELKKKKKKLYC